MFMRFNPLTSQFDQTVAMTNWESWTPTGSWVTGCTYSGYRRRLGDTAEYIVQVSLTGTPTAATLTITLDLTIDTEKLTQTGANMPLGVASVLDIGSSLLLPGATFYNSSTTVIPYTTRTATPDRYSVLNSTAPITWANGDTVTMQFHVPIVGWTV